MRQICSLLDWTVLENYTQSPKDTRSIRSEDMWRKAGTNIYGFGGLPSGLIKGDYKADDIGRKGYWWTSNRRDGKFATVFVVGEDGSTFESRAKFDGCSIRLVKDK